MLKSENIKYILLITILCFLSRLSILLDSGLVLDGDECVVALMAKHAYQGKEISIFFWGQNYGFTLVEVLFILPFYAIFGVTTIAVKLAMLSLWSIGVIFLYKTMIAIDNKNKVFAFLLILILILCPTWSNWSMEARGGYLTSFTATSITLFILFSSVKLNTYIRYILIGLFTYIVYTAQPFWLAGLVPLVVYKMIREKKLSAFLVMIISAAVMAYLINLINNTTEIVYAVHPNYALDSIVSNVTRFPEYLYKSLQGNYAFAWYQETSIFHKVFAGGIVVLVFLIAVFSCLHLIFNKKNFGLFITSTIFIPVVLVYSLTTDEMQGRYLLPVVGFTLLALYIYQTRLRITVLLNSIAVILIILCSLSTLAFPAYFDGQTNRKDLETTLTHLKKHNIKYLYATNCMLPWEVMFYSDETILCRMFYFPGRYPTYDTIVDYALYRGEKTAVIGYWREYAGLEFDSLDFENHYYISRNATKQFLSKAFEFPLADTLSSKQ